MLGIYADAFMIATRTETQTVVDARKGYQGNLGLKRFLPRRKKEIDLRKL